MKRKISRLAAILLISCMFLGMIPAVYAADDFQNTWVNTGDQAADIVGIARTQIGYAAPSEGHSKYNEWYYGSDTALSWCSIFISWCANQAGIETDVVNQTNCALGISKNFNPFGGNIYQFGEVTPQPGDIISSVTTKDTDYSTHTALVVDVDDTYIYTVEGNSHTNYVGYVKEQRYLLHDAEDGSAGYQTYIWASGNGRSVSDYIHILYIIRPNYHKYGTPVTVAPTCTENGYTKKVCTICGKSSEYNYVAARGHSYDQGTLTTEMTDTQDGIVTYICRVCGTKRYEVLPAGGSPFVDVQNTGAYYYNPVQWGTDSGIVYGTSQFEFSPSATCTRAQVVTFLYRTAGQPDVSDVNNPFTDVKPTDYYYKAVLWGYQHGIVYGTTDTTFSPNDKVTRAQFITFLYRYAEKPEPGNSENPFEDLPEGEYYTDAVRWGKQAGVVAGIDETHFGPSASCTRGQVVTFLWRYSRLEQN